MTKLSDGAVRRLRDAADWPEFEGIRYEILERIGQGGMGSVYLAEDIELRRRVALKVMRAPAPHAESESRMRREAQVIARLEHPGIVPVHDIGTLADGRMFYVMKWVRGVDFESYVAGRSIPDLLRVFLKVCEAVAFAHENGVVHRDLKPSNIMVGVFGEVLVLDWGVAKLVGEAPASSLALPPLPPGMDAITLDGAVVGTPGYMAPEQASGNNALIDQRSDVYALGTILRHLLAGASSVPRPLAAISSQAVQQSPELRYGSVAALSADVLHYLDGEAVTAYHEGVFERTRRIFVRYRTPILLVLAYLLMRGLLAVLARP